MTATTTILDIARDIRASGDKAKANKSSPSIIEGKTAHKAPAKTGYMQLTPEQLLAVRVERVGLNGVVDGYQRPLTVAVARRIAKKLTSGGSIAPPTLALDNGTLYVVDGQHRVIAAVIAWKPLWVVVESLSKEQRAERFADQRLAVRPSTDIIVLASPDPLSMYIKEGIEAEANGSEHPLAGVVGLTTTAAHVGAGAFYGLAAAYVMNHIGSATAAKAWQQLLPAEQRKRFSREVTDEFALLIRCFGPKSMAHPVIYRPATLSALTDLAIAGVRRSPKKPEDVQRWCKRMPAFDWNGAVWATRHNEIRPILTAWWNKRLPANRKVQF